MYFGFEIARRLVCYNIALFTKKTFKVYSKMYKIRSKFQISLGVFFVSALNTVAKCWGEENPVR